MAQTPTPIPSFSSNTVRSYGSSNLLAPGIVVEIWGSNMAPGYQSPCVRANEPYPHEMCGVRVLVGSSPAELMYVSPGQINIRIPGDAPPDGLVPFRVCSGDVCSAPVEMRFSSHTAFLSLERPASVHMPVWIHVDAPAPDSVQYPCGYWPWGFGDYEFEVLRDGRSLPPLPKPTNPNAATADKCIGPTVRSLPLHLFYRFEEPGEYEVRLTARKDGAILYQSDWTPIQIGPYSPEEREKWLRSVEATLPKFNWNNLYDVIPSLLAWPDAKALALLLKIIPAETGMCTNFDCIRLFFSTSALAAFDPALLRQEIQPERLRALCKPLGDCRLSPEH
jgi:hypothetical protein